MAYQIVYDTAAQTEGGKIIRGAYSGPDASANATAHVTAGTGLSKGEYDGVLPDYVQPDMASFTGELNMNPDFSMYPALVDNRVKKAVNAFYDKCRDVWIPQLVVHGGNVESLGRKFVFAGAQGVKKVYMMYSAGTMTADLAEKLIVNVTEGAEDVRSGDQFSAVVDQFTDPPANVIIWGDLTTGLRSNLADRHTFADLYDANFKLFDRSFMD